MVLLFIVLLFIFYQNYNITIPNYYPKLYTGRMENMPSCPLSKTLYSKHYTHYLHLFLQSAKIKLYYSSYITKKKDKPSLYILLYRFL